MRIIFDVNDDIATQLRHNMLDRREKIVYENFQPLEGYGGDRKFIHDDFLQVLERGDEYYR